jgi:hypothetical protein
LLSVEDPVRAPADVRAHLSVCEYCRDWHEDLCTFEHNVPFLPVPRSRGKEKLLARLLSEDRVAANTLPEASRASAPTLPETSSLTEPDHPILIYPRPFTFPSVMAGLAAVLLLVLSTWLLHN